MIRTLSIAVLAAASVNAQAAFEFALDRYQLSGNVIFDDTFTDGIVDPDWPANGTGLPYLTSGGTTTETADPPTAGYRVFDRANSDGSNEIELDGQTFDNITLTAFALIQDSGAGTTTLEGTWRPDLGQIASLGIGSGYGMLFAGDPASALILGVFSNGAGQAVVTYRDLNNIYGVAPLAAATGNVVLELSLDHATNLASARYSADSGATFLTLDTLLSPPQPLVYQGGFAGSGAFGQENTTVVPLPAALPFLISGLAGLGAAARRSRAAAH